MRKLFVKYHYIAATFYFLILTIIFTRPLVNNIATHTVGGFGDNLYFMWIIGWTKQALFDLGQLPHKSFLLNHPYGYHLVTTEISPLQILFALPITLLTDNPVLGYNVAILATFIFSGLTMYFWVFRLTRSYGAALVASTAFAFLPYHFAHFLSGHQNISAIQWFPLYFMGFIQILNSKEFTWKNVLFFVFSLACIAFTSQYYLYMSLFISFVTMLILIFQKNYRNNFEMWKQFVVVGFLSLPLLLVAVGPYYLVHRGANSVRRFEDVMQYSAGFTDYLLPFTKSIWAGKWVSNNFPRALWNEATLYLGISVVVLALYGFFKNKNEYRKTVIHVISIIALIAFILSLGKNLTWMEEPVVITTPDWLKHVIKKDSFYLFLPGYLLFRYFPFYNIMRAWMRFGIIVMTMMCVMAGIGVFELLKHFNKKMRFFVVIALIGIVIFDFMNTPFSIVEVKPREVDRWLYTQPDGGQVQLPFGESFDQSTIYYTLSNQKPLIGQVPAFPSHRYFKLESILRNFPDQTSVEALKTAQIRYIILNEESYSVNEDFQRKCEELGLQYEGSFDGKSVFIIQ